MDKQREKAKYEYMYRMNMYQMSKLIPSMHMSDIANKEYCYVGKKLHNFNIKKQEPILDKKIKRHSFRKKLKWFKDNKRRFKRFLDKSKHYTRLHKINRNEFKIDHVTERLLDIIPGTPIKRFSFRTFKTIEKITYTTKKRYSHHLLTEEDRKRLLSWNKR